MLAALAQSGTGRVVPAFAGVLSLAGEPIVRIPLGVLGTNSGAAFAATVGPLVEVEALIGLVKGAPCLHDGWSRLALPVLLPRGPRQASLQ